MPLRSGNRSFAMPRSRSYRPMTLNDLTVRFDHLDRESVLADWVWLIGKSKLPIMLTACGDAFVQDVDDGSVHFIDVAAGAIAKVADSITEFQTHLSERQFVIDYFAAEMVGDLLESGVRLDPSQVYSFKVPPILGGEFALDNIERCDLDVHYSIAGQLHQKVRGLPPGTKIGGVSIE